MKTTAKFRYDLQKEFETDDPDWDTLGISDVLNLLADANECASVIEKTYCAYCSKAYSVDNEAGIEEHINACEEHPLQKLRKKFSLLKRYDTVYCETIKGYVDEEEKEHGEWVKASDVHSALKL